MATVLRWGERRAARVRFAEGSWREICPDDLVDYVAEENNSEIDPALAPAAHAEASAALAQDLQGLSAMPGNLVDAIVSREGLAPFGLDNPRSGDVVVLLRPGIEFAHGRSSVPSVPTNRGSHGYRNATLELDATFAAIGPGIEPSRPATVSLLEVASRAARALGIEPPRGAVRAGR